MKFYPEEVLFSLTTRCNLKCAHCFIEKSEKILPKKSALKFLSLCKDSGIERVGFTGGEPFLASDFLCAIVRKAMEEDMVFDRIMTNGVWWKNEKELRDKLCRLFNAGYDGSICVSVDAFHKQNLKKLSNFFKIASSIWNREDLCSVAFVSGARDNETKQKIKKLLSLLNKILRSKTTEYFITRGIGCALIPGASSEVFPRRYKWPLNLPFGHLPRRYVGRGKGQWINVIKIDLAPIGKAAHLKNPWDGRWFKEDYCRGPGNVLFVMPDGSVKPCCGYATDMEQLTIGNIRYDSVSRIVKNANENRFVFTIFNSGLSAIRKRLQWAGFKFPGKTSNHCYFCWYVIKNVPRKLLFRCLD